MRVAKSTSLIAFISTGLRIGGGLVALPIALKTIPQAELGLYYTFLGIGSIMTLFDLGFASAVNRNASYAMAGARKFVARGIPEFSGRHEPNLELLSGLLAAVKRWYFLLGICAAIILLTFGSWFILSQLERSSLPKALFGSWIIFAFSSILTFTTSYWMNMLLGSGFVRDATKANLIAQVTGLAVLIVLLLSSLGIWSYGISLAASGLITWYLNKRLLIGKTGLDLNAESSFSLNQIIADLWPMAWRQGVVALGAFLIQRGNTLICSAKLGLEETGRYGLSLSLMLIILQTALVPLSLAQPEISRMRVRQENGAIWNLFWKRLYPGLLAASCGIFVLSFWGNGFLMLLGSKTTLLPTATLLLLGLVTILEQHHSQYGSLVLTENQNPFIKPALISGIAIAFLSWLGAQYWHAAGLIAAQGFVQLCWNNWWTIKRGLAGLRKSPLQ